MHFGFPRIALSFLLIAAHGISTRPQDTEPWITGRVVRADDGLPIEGAKVEFRYSWAFSSNGEFPTAISDTHGDYRSSESLKAGPYEIVASAEGFVPKRFSRDGTLEGSSQELDASTRIQGINFQLQREAVIRGTLIDLEGKAVGAGIWVALFRKVKDEDSAVRLRTVSTMMTDAAGQFMFKNLEPETYFVCVDGRNGRNGIDDSPHPAEWLSEVWYGNANSAEEATPLALNEGDVRDNLRITVRREKRYRVIVWPSGPDGQAKDYSFHIAGRRTGYARQQDGSYVIEGVPPGYYQLSVMASGEGDFIGAGDVSFEVTDADVTLHLELGGPGEIEGVVKAHNVADKVLPEVMLTIDSKLTRASQGSGVDGAGHIKFERVLPGPYVFRPLKMPDDVVLRSVRCGGAEITPAAPLRVGDKQKVTDCEFVLEHGSRNRVIED